jgi:4-hydroxy-3-methylbut-2-enyl diphosphate reductase
MPAASPGSRRVLLAAPRGYCAGVDRAVVTVEKALELYGPPVYVRKQIVHNRHVVETLEQRGAIFVEETDDVPEGATVVFSAHGVARSSTRRRSGDRSRRSTPPARW